MPTSNAMLDVKEQQQASEQLQVMIFYHGVLPPVPGPTPSPHLSFQLSFSSTCLQSCLASQWNFACIKLVARISSGNPTTLN